MENLDNKFPETKPEPPVDPNMAELLTYLMSEEPEALSPPKPEEPSGPFFHRQS